MSDPNRAVIPRRAVGWILAAITVAIVVANQEHVGIARDEVVYMQAGVRYADFWAGLALHAQGLDHVPEQVAADAERFARLERAKTPGKVPAAIERVKRVAHELDRELTTDTITRTFGGPNPTDNNREHPPLMKTLFGLSHRVLHVGLGVDELTAYRLPSAVLHGVLVLLVFLMVLELWGLAEATLSGLFVMFLPRALFHAGLACFDAPITTLWFATIYAYWRALDGRRWPWLVGVVFGLALATKHNALLLPFALGFHYIVAGIRDRGVARVITYRWRVIVSLAVLAPLTLVAVWPWLWLDPIGHVKDWLVFHLEHVHYNFEYLGENWNAPPFPWHVPLVTTAFTVPAVTLAGGALGCVVWLARRREVGTAERLPGVLLVLSAAASIGPFLVGSTPIFGAEKHWMPALPSLCIAAGLGTAWAARRLAALVPPGGSVNLWLRRAVLAVACALVIGAAAVETATAQPNALTWYSAVAGGAPGGADRGMNRQFWGVAARGVLPVLAADASARETPVYTHDASPAWGYYMKRGEVPPTMPDAGREPLGIPKSTYALVIHERHFNRHDYLIWKAYGTVQPMFVLRAAGVPIVTLYKRPVPRPPAERP